MKLHIEGLGLVGSLTALMLHEYGIAFTWSDNDYPVNAWKASTGCVYPSGDPVDMRSFGAWGEYFSNTKYKVLRKNLAPHMERARWCYTSKNPPHEGGALGVKPEKQFGPLTVSNFETYQFNVQRLVNDTRKLFAKKRLESTPSDGNYVIVSHGTASAVRYLWGWSALVALNINRELEHYLDADGQRPCLYLRKIYQMNYAYPVPGSGLYYAGTATVNQSTPSTPRNFDRTGVVQSWGERLSEMTAGLVTLDVVKQDSLREGWRPVPEESAPFVKVKTGKNVRLICKPMAGNGVRHFPELWLHIAKTLKVATS